MVRPNKDKFEETSYAFRKGTDHRLIQMSVPFWFNATMIDKYACGTTTQPVCEYYWSKDQIKEIFLALELQILKFEQFTTKLPNYCERCGRIGTPSIQKKSTYDNRVRTSDKPPSRNNRPDEYRWIYQHKVGKKICIIAIFDVEHFSFKNPTNRTSELDKHFFPRYLEKMKKELDISDFFQKLTNVSHA